ncbi:MAG: hypothetical protein IPI00_06995 [Flavobacteriales bacterium]|nr:hypothetical protein [Flavobacteriales bacterium]MBK9535767.1 hypothetical protein [Flavobacteriales bacterium]MBP9138755.1 hypothetical protein [Flavobacteriales bacterium]HQX29782.1 hypothetical protein [Flavobacteriales bacterium]HQX38567.1 hypothetical protein [Flavobacteriales bacterium]
MASLANCVAQKNMNMVPYVDDKFSTFDIKAFDQERVDRKRVIQKDGMYIEEEIQSYGYIRRTYHNDSYFKVNEKYYATGGIKTRALLFNSGSERGFRYEFNERGSVVSREDTDTGYSFTWDDVIAYCNDRAIPLVKGYVHGGWQTMINKNKNDEGIAVWVVTWKKGLSRLEEITLDGATGELLNTRDLEFVDP